MLSDFLMPTNAPDKVYKLAWIASHPIQYQTPLFRALAEHKQIDLTVYFCSRHGLDESHDPGFNISFAWDLDLLSGYRYRFLRNLGSGAGPDHNMGVFTPSIASVFFENYDAVVSSGWASVNHWITWAGAALTRTPLLLRGEANGLSGVQGIKRHLKRMALRLLFSRVAGCLTIGTLNTRYLRSLQIPDAKMFLTPYAVENSRFQYVRRSERTAIRRKCGITTDAPLFLFAGKLIPIKRPFDVLQAFLQARTHQPMAIAFAGDGVLRPALEAFAKEHNLTDVHFLGFQNQSDIPACYAMSDAFVLPSEQEPWGLVVNEAMCCGLPVIASESVGCVPDLVHNGRNGFTYVAGDIETLARSMTELAGSPALLDDFGQESLRIINKWTIDAAVNGIVESLACVGQRRSSALRQKSSGMAADPAFDDPTQPQWR